MLYVHILGREAAEAHIQSMGCSDGMFLVRRKDKYTMAITLAFKNKISHLLIETGTFYTLKSNDVFDRALCLDELIQQMRLVRQGWATPLETPVTRTMIKAGQVVYNDLGYRLFTTSCCIGGLFFLFVFFYASIWHFRWIQI